MEREGNCQRKCMEEKYIKYSITKMCIIQVQSIYLIGRIGPGFIVELCILNFSNPIITVTIAVTILMNRRLFRLPGWLPQNGVVIGYATSSAHQMVSRSYSQYYLYFDLLKKEIPNFLYSV